MTDDEALAALEGQFDEDAEEAAMLAELEEVAAASEERMRAADPTERGVILLHMLGGLAQLSGETIGRLEELLARVEHVEHHTCPKHDDEES